MLNIYNKVCSVVYSAVLLAAILCLCACGGDTAAKLTEQNPETPDLKVAVFPSLDAVPLALANDWGVFDSLGVKVELAVFRSQMDAEKALADGKADAVLTDMFRVGWWQWHRKPVQFAFATKRHLFIVPNRVLRISKADQLDDRMIAGTRFSMEDYFAERVVAGIKNRKGQILHPQINSVELRLSMLKAGQLDAAVLNTQQALKARSAGYASLNTEQLDFGFAGVAYNSDSVKVKRAMMGKLRQAYDIVVSKLRQSPTLPQISEQTRKALFLNEGVDSVINTKTDFAPTSAPNSTRQDEATAWLRNHGIN